MKDRVRVTVPLRAEAVVEVELETIPPDLDEAKRLAIEAIQRGEGLRTLATPDMRGSWKFERRMIGGGCKTCGPR